MLTTGCDSHIERLLILYTAPFTAPDRLYMSHANLVSRQLTFNWSTVSTDCPAIHYNILSSNCGSCPTTTNHTTVICVDIPTNSSVCTFAVQSVVCGNITGQRSNPIMVSASVAMVTVNVLTGSHTSTTVCRCQ